MKKKIAVLLAVVMVMVSAFGGLMSASAELLSLTDQEQQDVFDAWFAFLYTDEWVMPMSDTYDTYESYEQAESSRILLSDTKIDCYYNHNNVIAVRINHSWLSAVDIEWLDRVGSYNFDFSGVTTALYIYKDHTLYNLKTAYADGIIDDTVMDEIFYACEYGLYPVGDVDRNDQITVSDVVNLRGYIMDGTYLSSPFYDIDASGEATVADVVALRDLIMKG